MIEVLVTVFVVAIALLGTAALQAYSLKVNQGSQFRAQAVILGANLLERLEANNAGAIAGAYAGSLPLTGTVPACDVSACTPQSLAVFDLDQVGRQMADHLPESSALVTLTGAGPYTYTIRLTWRERISKAVGSSASTETFSYTVSRTIHDQAGTL